MANLEGRAVRFFFVVLDVELEDSDKDAKREPLEIPAFLELLFEDEFVSVPVFWAGLSLFSEALNVVDSEVAEAFFDEEDWLFEVEIMEDGSVELSDEVAKTLLLLEVEVVFSSNTLAGVVELDDNPIHAPAPPTMKNKEAMLNQKPMPFFFLRRILFSISGQLCSGASGRNPSAAR